MIDEVIAHSLSLECLTLFTYLLDCILINVNSCCIGVLFPLQEMPSEHILLMHRPHMTIYVHHHHSLFTVEGDLRLVGGENRCEGRLQIAVLDLRSTTNSLQWSTTCDRDFSTEEIRTACRQLGCPTGYPGRQSISRYYYTMHAGVHKPCKAGQGMFNTALLQCNTS